MVPPSGLLPSDTCNKEQGHLLSHSLQAPTMVASKLVAFPKTFFFLNLQEGAGSPSKLQSPSTHNDGLRACNLSSGLLPIPVQDQPPSLSSQASIMGASTMITHHQVFFLYLREGAGLSSKLQSPSIHNGGLHFSPHFQSHLTFLFPSQHQFFLQDNFFYPFQVSENLGFHDPYLS